MARKSNISTNGGTTATGTGVGTSKRRRSPQADVARDPSPTGRTGLQDSRNASAPGLGDQIKTGRERAYASKGGKLRKSLGKGWQKKVYGKDFKYGTLKNLNQSVRDKRSKTMSINERIKELESQQASGGNKDQIQARLEKLESNKKIVAGNLLKAKDSREGFTKLRDKAIDNIATKSVGERKRLRDKAISKVLNRHKVK